MNNHSFFFIGASSGIGRELAKQLARISPTTRLIISARREKELRALAEELDLDFEHCLVLPLDLELQYDFFKSKVDLVLERFGHIDVLINSAGISQRSFIRETAYKVDSRLMDVNFLGPVTLSKTVLQVNYSFFCHLYSHIKFVLAFYRTTKRTFCGCNIYSWLCWFNITFILCCI